MHVFLIAMLSGVGFIVAYRTYGRWLGSSLFQLSSRVWILPAYSLFT